MKVINKYIKQKNLMPAIGMVVGTLIYCIGVVWIISIGNFFAGGVTGVAQILAGTLKKIFHLEVNINVALSIVVPLLNLPLFIIGYKHVSKRFAFLTLGSVVLQSILIFALEKSGWSPLNGLVENRLLLAIVGGLVTGTGLGIALRAGASTGGMDIISQYFYFKKKIPFTKFSLLVDLAIIVFGGILNRNIETSIYTAIRLVISVMVIGQLYTTYKFIKLDIITIKRDEVCEALLSKFNHGITIYEAMGGYTKSKKWVMEIVVSRFELDEYKEIVKGIDDKVFITYSEVKGVVGFFNQNKVA